MKKAIISLLVAGAVVAAKRGGVSDRGERGRAAVVKNCYVKTYARAGKRE